MCTLFYVNLKSVLNKYLQKTCECSLNVARLNQDWFYINVLLGYIMIKVANTSTAFSLIDDIPAHDLQIRVEYEHITNYCVSVGSEYVNIFILKLFTNPFT